MFAFCDLSLACQLYHLNMYTTFNLSCSQKANFDDIRKHRPQVDFNLGEFGVDAIARQSKYFWQDFTLTDHDQTQQFPIENVDDNDDLDDVSPKKRPRKRNGSGRRDTQYCEMKSNNNDNNNMQTHNFRKRRSPFVGLILLACAAAAACLLEVIVAPNFRLANALDNGLARTPPMGWLAWERFTCEIDCDKYPNSCINHELFGQMAELLRKDGWADVGYKYVNIDDCWSEMVRDPKTRRLVPDRHRFPLGIKSLAERVHELGLKLGIYGDCGHKTCAGYPAQLLELDKEAEGEFLDDDNQNNFRVDANTLADWKIDSFKFDGCHIDPLQAERVCPLMSSALNATNRPILLVCEWPFYMMYDHAEADFELAGKACNVWRYYDDIEDSWSSILNTVDYTIRHQNTIVKYHGPGRWFDPDQLVIGNFGLSIEQSKAQMAIWAIWAAPLYMSNDLRNIRSEHVAVLKNKHLIGVNQDALGVFGLAAARSQDEAHVAFIKPVLPIKNNCPSFAIVYLNRRALGNTEQVSFELGELLRNAPIRQAAKNQLDATPEVGPKERIEANRCLERIAHHLTKLPPPPPHKHDAWFKPGPPHAGKAPEVRNGPQFEVFDLFANGRKLFDVRSSDKLELLVNPSSVRAVKLVELDKPQAQQQQQHSSTTEPTIVATTTSVSSPQTNKPQKEQSIGLEEQSTIQTLTVDVDDDDDYDSRIEMF